jgi:release factor glutamine methyltransferase
MGITTARLDAELLVAHALGCDRVGLYIDMERPLQADELARIRKLVVRRRRREPVAYILGRREFFGRQFEVTPAVLIPRPDTETLVERALGILDREHACRVLDLCTGSGAIGVTLAAEREQLTVDATDISGEALQVAGRNAAKHGVEARVRFFRGDLFSALPRGSGARGAAREGADGYGLIVCNPPYITGGQWQQLAPEVTGFEPEIALRAGVDGLDCHRRICAEAGDWLQPGGSLLLEVGHGQAEAVAEMLRGSGRFSPVIFHADLAGIRRVVEGRGV